MTGAMVNEKLDAEIRACADLIEHKIDKGYHASSCQEVADELRRLAERVRALQCMYWNAQGKVEAMFPKGE